MRKIYLSILFAFAILGIFNPSLNDFERFVHQGMGSNLIDKSNENIYREVFSVIGINKLAARQNYFIFSVYEISPSLISTIAIEAGNNVFAYDFANSKVIFLGVFGSFYAIGNSSRSVNSIYGFLELCRVGAIDCKKFARRYGL